MYSCATRSNASVVTPGATDLPASASAPAAIRPATRIFSITSGVCTHGSVPSRAVDLPTYSGRGIDLGTGSVGETAPAISSERTGRTGIPTSVSVCAGSNTPPRQQRPAWSFDLDRSAHHPTGQHHMRGALGGCVFPAVAGAAAEDLDVVDRRAGAVGQSNLDRSKPHVELDDDDRPSESRLDQVQLDGAHPAHQRQPARYGPLAVPLERPDPAAQLHSVGRRRDDRSRPGQVTDEAVQFVAGAGVGHVRGAFLELTDVDQPERDRIVQSAQRAVAVGIGYPQLGQFVRARHGASNLPPPDAQAPVRRPERMGQLREPFHTLCTKTLMNLNWNALTRGMEKVPVLAKHPINDLVLIAKQRYRRTQAARQFLLQIVRTAGAKSGFLALISR